MRPLFSVLVPTFNRRDTLVRCLDAWRRQTPDDLPFELVVVDDGSDDGTREWLADWQPGERFALRVAHQANAGPAAARNRALEMARGEIVLFTGDDVEPTPALLAEHREGHRALDDERAIVLGLTRWPPGDALTATMRHVDGPGGQQFSYPGMRDGGTYDFRHFYTSNVSLRRSLLDREPSYFDTGFPAAAFEDAELAYRLERHGARIVYRASAVAHHHHPYTVRAFYRRQERCGAMAALLYRKHPQLEKWLGMRDLLWLSLEDVAGGRAWRRRRRQVEEELDALEERVLEVASAFDAAPSAPVDLLLAELFRYAYLRGLIGALEDDDAARRLAATVFLRVFPVTVRRFRAAPDIEALLDGLPRQRPGRTLPLVGTAPGRYPEPDEVPLL